MVCWSVVLKTFVVGCIEGKDLVNGRIARAAS